MSLKIEQANLTDLTEIFKLSLVLNDTEPIKEDVIKNAIENNLTWVAKDINQIVGYCFCELFDSSHDQLPNSIFVSELYVLESYRKQGIGKELVQKILNFDFPAQYTYFSLSHSPEEIHLTNFYESLGFEVIGKTKARNIKMIKKI